MRVLDLFAGKKGWSKPFEDRGHEVFSVEISRNFPGISLYADILSLSLSDIPWRPDIILASPPCTTYSMMTVSKYWTHDHQPRNEKAANALRMVEKAREIISWFPGVYHIIENPRAKLRKMPVMQDLEIRTVTYCQYGEQRMKPTDLFSLRFPPVEFKPACKNGAPCHVRAPRGSYTGTQGMASADSAVIPYQLALDVCLAMEGE